MNDSEFERCWPWLAAAIERFGHTHHKEHVRELLDGGQVQLHPLPNGALVTGIHKHPTGLNECRVWLGGGDLSEIVKVEPLMLEWMKSEKCDFLSISGRRGWAKVFPPARGYREVGTILVKDLNK